MDLNALLDKKAKKVSKKKDKSKSKLSETERIQLGLEEFAGLGTEPIALTHTQQSAVAAAAAVESTTTKPLELTKKKEENDSKDDHIITSNNNESNNHTSSNNLTSSIDDEKNKISVTNDKECGTTDISAKDEKNEKTYDNFTQRVDVNEDSKDNTNDTNSDNKHWMHSDTEKENSPEEQTLLEQNKEVQVDKEESSAHMEPSTSPMHIDHDDNLKANVVSIVNVSTDEAEENVTINNNHDSGVNEAKRDEQQQKQEEEDQEDAVIDATSIDFSDVTISTSSISKKIRSWSDVKVDVLVSKLGKSASSANLNDSTKEEEQKEDKPKKFVARGKRNATGELALNFPLNKSASNAELPTLEEAIARRKNPKESNVESPSSATSPLTGKAGQDERNKSVS